MDANTNQTSGKSVDPQHVIDMLREQVHNLIEENIMLGAYIRQQEARQSESSSDGGSDE